MKPGIVLPDTIGELLRFTSRSLLEAGIGSGALEASLLLGAVTGRDRLALITNSSETLEPEVLERLAGLLERHFAHEPLQHILGTQGFMGLDFLVSAEALIPRPDTEILVEEVLDRCQEGCGDPPAPSLADIGTGSGAIALSIASYLPSARVIATDISPSALELARRNAEKLNVRADFRLGNSFEPLLGLEESLDFVVSNPPYIPAQEIETLEPEVRDFEPRLALDGGTDGLDFYRAFALEAHRFLKPGGSLVLEVGADQAPSVLALLERAGEWEELGTDRDLGGIERVVFARRKGLR